MSVSTAMPGTNIETPDWLREMETILEELNEGVVVVDDQLRVIFANEALTRMGHFERNEIKGRTPDAIFPSEDLPYIRRQHESGHRYGRHRTEFYFPRKDGRKIPAIFSGRVIQGPDKRDYVLLTVTDISAQRGIEQQLCESNSLLQKRQDEMMPNSPSPHMCSNPLRRIVQFGQASLWRRTTVQPARLAATLRSSPRKAMIP